MNSKKGFTLIELLIVIAIIGVLAVAFLPSLLGAPAKGRDTSRIADLQKIQKVLINANLEGAIYPLATECIVQAAGVIGAVNPAAPAYNYIAALGGKAPMDPQPSNVVPGSNCAAGRYFYKPNPSPSYKFGLYAHVENFNTANTQCDDALGGTIVAPVAGVDDVAVAPALTNLCYAILTQ